MDQRKAKPRIEYYKLVRDHIPEIIQQDGKIYEITIMEKEEHEQALREKLVEEAREAATSSINNLETEIADLYEVIDALMKFHNIEENAVRELQKERYLERGGFEQHLRLLWVEG